MINKANKEVISFLMKGGLPDERNNQPQARFTQEAPPQKKKNW